MFPTSLRWATVPPLFSFLTWVYRNFFVGFPLSFGCLSSHTAPRKGKEIVKQRQSLTSFVKPKRGGAKISVGTSLANFKKCVRLLLRKLSFWLLLASNPTAIHIFCSTYMKPFSFFHSPYSVMSKRNVCTTCIILSSLLTTWGLSGVCVSSYFALILSHRIWDLHQALQTLAFCSE